MKNTVDTKGFNQYGMESYNDKVRLAEELEAIGEAAHVMKIDDDICVAIRNGAYYVKRIWKGQIIVFSAKNPSYENVSNSVRYEVSKRTQDGNKVFKLSASKLNKLIAGVDAYHAEMAGLNANAGSKTMQFLQEIKGYPFRMSKDNKSGWYTKNGLEFSFEIMQDGYISQKIRIDGRQNFATFLELAANEFTGKHE